MNTSLRIAVAIAAALLTTGAAEARHYRHQANHHSHSTHRSIKPHRIATTPDLAKLHQPIKVAQAVGCIPDNDGRTRCSSSPNQSRESTEIQNTTRANGEYTYRGMRVSERSSIPTPAGTHRINRSCAERLAAYWGLGSGLDGTWDWPRRFERASGPGPRVAVVWPGHVMGIIGGSPGAWRVVSFNGDGHHGNVEMTVDHVTGTLVDTTRPRMTSK